jgi:SAM-dependent methyltransferase
MDHDDHVSLLRDGVPAGGTWADLGSGDGAFTLALADLLGPGATIYSVDRDGRALQRQARAMRVGFPETRLEQIQADYTRPLDLPPLDGVVVANALHFQREREKLAALNLIRCYLKPGGRLLVVEYNRDRGNLWVPHAFSYATWQRLAAAAGFTGTRLLVTRPSRHLNEIYSAFSVKPETDRTQP